MVDYVEEPMKYQALKPSFFSVGGWLEESRGGCVCVDGVVAGGWVCVCVCWGGWGGGGGWVGGCRVVCWGWV